MKLRYFSALDGVRALAALMVMWFHFFEAKTTYSGILGSITRTAVFGQTGVSLFFVLSGFLITRILLETKEQPYYFKNFYVRRALRIFPLYYGFLVFTYFIYPFLSGSQFVPLNQQVWYWVYLQNFANTFNWPQSGPGHFWSLAVEEHFYLFWPLLVYYLDLKNLLRIIIAVVVIAFSTRLILLNFKFEVFYFTFCRFDELALGALLAIFEKKRIFELMNSKVLILSGFSILIAAIVLWNYTTGLKMPVIQAFKFNLYGIIYFCFVGYVILSTQNNWLLKFLNFKFLQFTGKISYGLYVYHPICFAFVKKVVAPQNLLLSFSTSFVISYLVSYFSFKYFESFFLKFKTRFA